MKRLILTFTILVLLSHLTYALDQTITGQVTSLDDGTALPGVNVILKGTTIGTITNSQGKYTITIPDTKGILIFSFIGYISEEIKIGTRKVIDIQLSVQVNQLSEIVVMERESSSKVHKSKMSYAVMDMASGAPFTRTEK